MLKLTGPVWLDLLPGARVRFRPVGSKALRAARRAAAAAFAEHGPEAHDDAGDAFSRELIRHGVIEWEGIGDVAGKPAPVAPETVEAFLDDARTFDAADALYVLPWVVEEAEKNGYSPSLDGTSGAKTAAKPIARTARRPARPVRTKSMSRGPKPAS